MNKIIFLSIFTFIVSLNTVAADKKNISDTIPPYLLGNFMDDYSIEYNISDSLWSQKPGVKYHIVEWNIKDKYLIAKNDENNPSEKGLYTRIDFMQFNNMEPFLWGFCLTLYNAASEPLARAATTADRQNTRKGCNGYPFSRMKRIVQ